MKAASNKYGSILICTALAAAALIAFEPVRHNGFVDLDDPLYVTENPNVKNGLTRQSLLWAFTGSHAAFWHPLTSLSHMLDCELFGLNPLGHHITSLLLHIANTLLLFLAMQNMTNAPWPSAFVAAAFALHPLHVESVAWVAERKDVLSGFFWMLTIIVYQYYVKHPNIKWYFLTLLIFVLGLMAKPMVVTLPFVLLLLDYWPLGRFPDKRPSKLIFEKVPFLAFSAAAAVIAFLFQQKQGALPSVDLLPVNIRIANALISYVRYIIKTFSPGGLAVFYPYSTDTIPVWQAAFSFLLLLGLFVLVIRFAKNHKYLLVGWLWYLGTLLPVIGLVQVGTHSMADRYTYLPLIGIFIIIAWGVAELFAEWRLRKIVSSISALAIIIVLILLTRAQVRYWHDSTALFEHTVAVTNNNYTIHNNLGVALQNQGKLDEAISHFRKSLQYNPDYFNAHYNLANALKSQGRLDKAVSHYYQALKIRPDDVGVLNNLGTALQDQGRLDEAVIYYQKALKIQPDLTPAHNNLGSIFLMQRKLDDAIAHFRQALLNSENAETYYNLSIAFEMQGSYQQAAASAQKALDLAVAAKNNDLARQIRSQLEIYKRQKPQ